MMMAFIKTMLILSLFSILFINVECRVLLKKEDKNIKSFERTLAAFEKALHFYNEDYGLINFDSLLGLRVAQGSLQKILIDNDNTNLKINRRYLARIRKMFTTAEKITGEAIPFVREDNVEQYEKFYTIISKPWAVFNQFQKRNPPHMNRDKNLKNIVFDGPTSDYCISLLLADSKTTGQSSCNVTDYCWEYETQKDLDGYTPTHQILYFLFGLGKGCENTLNQKFQEMGLKKGVQGFFDETCSNILRSVKRISQDTSLLKIEKDLFMEQILVCSLTGYEDFLTESYLEIILDWQTDVGCFGNQISEIIKKPSRKLLFERMLKDGCLVHESGVGIALLGQYVRWMLETRFVSNL